MSRLVFDEDFVPPRSWHDHSAVETRAYFQWLTAHLVELTGRLRAELAVSHRDWTPDYSLLSLQRVERWLELTASGAVERREIVRLDRETQMRAFYAGIYFGETLVHRFNARWGQRLKNKRDFLYGHALSVEADGSLCNPVGVASVTASDAVEGRASSRRFTSIFEECAKKRSAVSSASARATGSAKSGNPKRVDADLETWVRDLDEADEDLRQVDVIRESGSPRWAWRVVVALAEFVRDPDGESALVSAVESALLRARGAVEVVQQDREVWLVAGTSTGEQLVAALAPAIDALAAAYSASDEAED